MVPPKNVSPPPLRKITERERLTTGTYQALLRQDMWPWISATCSDQKEVLQQDSELAHTAISFVETSLCAGKLLFCCHVCHP